jgi:Phage integrase family/Phage integrase, N-terminal SAM-like domain
LARKRYQRGSVILQGNSWYGRYRVDEIGVDGQKRRVRKNQLLGSKKDIPTKRLAERRLEVLLAPVNSLAYRPGRVATVEEFAERWKAEILSKRKASTIHAANAHLRTHILPILGKLRLSDVGVENQQVFVTRLSGVVSCKMLLNVLGTLSSILTTAQNWGYTCEGINYRKLALPEKAEAAPAACFSPCNAAKIINMAVGQYRVMFAIAAMAGLRAGEILALQVGDFDLEANLLTVRRSVWRGKVSTPKTSHSLAVLPIPEELARIVREHVASLQNEWLFLNSRGHFFFAEKVVEQALWPILDKLGLPRCGFHAFRHLHSSLLLSSGATPKVAQAQLRHADARITLGIYGHVIGNEHREAVDKVASILDLTGPNSQPSTVLIQ